MNIRTYFDTIKKQYPKATGYTIKQFNSSGLRWIKRNGEYVLQQSIYVDIEFGEPIFDPDRGWITHILNSIWFDVPVAIE